MADGNPYGNYAFACTYWRYHRLAVDFDDDLKELVRQAYRAEDNGEQSTGGFWQAVGTGWARVDTSSTWEKIVAEEVAEAEQRNSDRETKPWIVTIYGPGDASSFESSHATAEEAAEAVKKYPAHVRPTVTKR